MKQGLIVSCGNIPKLCLCIFVLCGYFVMWPSVMCDECSILIGYPFVCKIYTKFGRCTKIMWSSSCAGNSLMLSLPCPFYSIYLWACACQAPYLIFYILTTSKSAMSSSIPDTSKVGLPHPFDTFRPLTDYSNFEANVICPAIRAARSFKHWIQDDQSFQHHALLWKRLSNFFSKQTIIILVIDFVFFPLFLFRNFLRQFLWPAQRLLWARSVTNTLTAMCGRVDFLRQGLMLCWVQLTRKQR